MQLLSKTFIFVLGILLLSACLPASSQQETISENLDPVQDIETTVTVPTVVPETELPTPIIQTEIRPTSTAVTRATEDAEPTEAAHPQPENIETQYRVAFVENNDVLNVREGPGAEFDIRSALDPGDTSISKINSVPSSSGSTWFNIDDKETTGWVNSNYLVEQVDPETFCSSPEAATILDDLLLALKANDGELLSDLVPESRGIRIRRHWWNPEVHYQQNQLETIFTDDISHSWGVADGSGEPIEGTFSTVMGPLITNNMLKSTEIACNEIIHGGTAGLITLPDSYEGINYFSLYREPGPDSFELDWGTWVVGIESWEGEYYLSFMVHYEWEI